MNEILLPNLNEEVRYTENQYINCLVKRGEERILGPYTLQGHFLHRKAIPSVLFRSPPQPSPNTPLDLEGNKMTREKTSYCAVTSSTCLDGNLLLLGIVCRRGKIEQKKNVYEKIK